VQFTQEHAEIRRTLRAVIDKDINPHVDQWEEDGIFPAHEVFKKLGDAGLLGINKPVEFGGMGLDYSSAPSRNGCGPAPRPSPWRRNSRAPCRRTRPAC
jgi:alkylation response protein AidB-like acyl-CoA dehydrogenase